MKLSDKGEDIIKNFEGLRLDAYRDIAGVWTIGYGSTEYHDGKSINPGDKLANEAIADALFRNTLGQYENAVNTHVHVPITQNQYDALVSITYNEGTGVMIKSTLMRKLSEGDYRGAADQFLVWDKITDRTTGKKIVCNTLTKRRSEERRLFLSDINKPNT